MTSSHSCSVMLKIIRSRRMPATLTRMSSRPNSSMAVWTRLSAAAKSAMSAPLATALPPASAISATTSCAGPVSCPEPSTAAPRSLTTTEAPSLASSLATDLPMPRPGAGDDRDPPVQTCHASSPSRVPITGIFFWN